MNPAGFFPPQALYILFTLYGTAYVEFYFWYGLKEAYVCAHSASLSIRYDVRKGGRVTPQWAIIFNMLVLLNNIIMLCIDPCVILSRMQGKKPC